MISWESRLANAIILQAIEDIQKYWPSEGNFYGAEKFLKSDWFHNLAEHIEIHPDKIIRKVDEIKMERAVKWHKKMIDMGVGAELFNLSETDDPATILSKWMKSPNPKPKKNSAAESVHTNAQCELK